MIEHARMVEDPTLEVRFLPSLAACALYGPTPVEVAEERCNELLVKADGDRRTMAIIQCVIAHLLAMQGRFEEARARYRRSRAMLEELGWRFHASLTSIDSGAVELLAGDFEAAEAELRGDLEVLQSMGERDYMPTIAALLSETLYQQGRLDEAEATTGLSEDSAAPNDVFSQYLWRSVRAKVLARRGDHVDAELLSKEAVRLIDSTDDPDSQGNARMDLAEVYALAGRTREAEHSLQQAAASLGSKGNVSRPSGHDGAGPSLHPRGDHRRRRVVRVRPAAYSARTEEGTMTQHDETNDPDLTPTLAETARRRADLHQALVALEEAISRPAVGRGPDWAKDVLRDLEELGRTIDEHVEVTERPGGLYDEIAAKSPRLSNNIGRLREEHPMLRDGTRELIERLRTTGVDDAWPLDQARDDLQRLLGRIVRHRQLGSDLVWEAYNLDIGGIE